MKYIYILVVCVLFSCSPSVKNNQSDKNDLVSMDLSKMEERNLFLDEEGRVKCKLLPLETNSECLIKWIEKIVIDDNYVFVKDMNKKLFVFDLNTGRFLHQIGRMGGGPEELLSFYDFYVDKEQKQVCIYDGTRGAFLHFSYQGDLQGIKKCAYRTIGEFQNLTWVSDKSLIAGMCNSPVSRFCYRVMEPDGYTYKGEFLPYCVVGEISGSSSGSKVAGCDSTVYALGFLSDTIYQYVDKVGFLPKYVFECGLKHRDNETFDEEKQYECGFDAIATLGEKNMSVGIDALFLIDEYLYYTYFKEGQEYQVWWDIHKQKGYYVKIQYVPNNCIRAMDSLGYYTTTKNALVSVVTPEKLMELNEDALVEQGIKEVVSKVNEDDNPVLVFYYINSMQ